MGSGGVYRSDQPDYLLMNFANKYINMWTESSPPPVVDQALNFSAFIRLENQTPLDETEPIYASRASVGRYLENGFAQLSQSHLQNVTLKQHTTEVRNIEKMDEGYSIGFMQKGKNSRLTGFQHILICTGHQRHKETAKTSHHTVPFIYPVQENLRGVTTKDMIAVKGMGLTFIDAVLALTEGSGGHFLEHGDGKVIYKASGKEPKRIFPFSKSGWPMLPKYDFNSDHDPQLYASNLRSISGEKLSFKNQILPLIAQDMEVAYYVTLFSHEREVLKSYIDYSKVKSQIHNFHKKHLGYPPFSLERLLVPEFNPEKTHHQNVLEYLCAFTSEASRHIVNEAHLRAAAVWRRISPVFNEIYAFSGLDAASQQEFDGYYFGKLNRIAYGPPPSNLKKIIALAKTGIVDFQYAKNPRLEVLEAGFMLSNGISRIFCNTLVDARIPKNSMEKEATGLYQHLCEKRLARPYVNKDPNFSYTLSTVEIDRNGNLINPDGNAENITLYGTPTEGVVHDNDTLSRNRNNFADPWARGVIRNLMNSTDEINKQTPNTFTNFK